MKYFLPCQLFPYGNVTFFWIKEMIYLEPLIITTSADMETNECLTNNGGCWQDKAANITACRVFG